jgi:acyl-CoA thioesterase-1
VRTLSRRRLILSSIAIVAISGCSLRNVSCGAAPPPQVAQETAPSPEDPGSGGRTLTIAFLGDSLTAGLGLLSQEAYPSILDDMFEAEGYGEVEVSNAGISGDTTAGGLRRIEQVVSGNVEIVVVALGGNDALRGLSIAQTYDNLNGIIEASLNAGADVLLVGMQAPTNLGEDYQSTFRALYNRLALEHGRQVKFIPFLLEGVAGQPELNQQDGIHPNAAGARKIAELLYPKLRDMVDQRLGSGGGAPHE